MFGTTVTVAQVSNRSATVLANMRDALKQAQDLAAWVLAQADSDLTGIGYTTDDVSKLKSALADANEVASVYLGNPLGETYTLPYNFSASQRQIIGPGL